ncbi:MAG: 4a-hydroxytetrahydrobiopterin dehydratase [Nanoarchaeota archaeon]|nr:4a-hydroxytetrahydrobiopterin dehydratase [Nanoarchaeota archaeon]
MLTLEQIKEGMENLRDWSLEGDSIVRDFMFQDSKVASEFIARVNELADKIDHHPLILMDQNHIRLSLTTHSAGGITEKDLEMAAEIDKIYLS